MDIGTILLWIFCGVLVVASLGICFIMAFTKKKTLKAAGVKLYSREGIGRAK